MSNNAFNRALRRIDKSMVAYIQNDRNDERSHANFINAYLASMGETPLNLDAFRTIPSSTATGAASTGRLTNLTNLTVDTSWYNRYRGTQNVDTGGAPFPQLVNITNQPAIPPMNGLDEVTIQAIANVAAFHFCAIEQGGGSLYNALSSNVSHPDTVAILASIGPTEVYHFGVFHTTIENIQPLVTDSGMVFPDLAGNDTVSRNDFPNACFFLNESLPFCSVIRPRNISNAGAVAAATGLGKSGLFMGQSQQFFDAVVALAMAADAATRS